VEYSGDVSGVYMEQSFCQKLIVAQLGNIFSAFHGIGRLSIMFTSLRTFSILSYNLCLGLPSGFFASGFPVKPFVYMCAVPCMLHQPPVSLIRAYWQGAQIMMFLVQFPSLSCHLILCRSIYSPRHLVL
jgi:hypothetical protein